MANAPVRGHIDKRGLDRRRDPIQTLEDIGASVRAVFDEFGIAPAGGQSDQPP